MNKKERNAMFKIHDDKVYFVAETPDINKVMRNGNDYYIIDMALAENSALNDCVPKNLLRAYPQQWLPGESNS